MVLFGRKNPDGTDDMTWRGTKRKQQDGEAGDPAFEFDRKRQFKDKTRPFAMYLVQGLPPMPSEPGMATINLDRSHKNRELAIAALREVDALDPYFLKLDHCNAIFAPIRPGPARKGAKRKPVAVDSIFLNKASGSLVRWLLTMFEDQAQVLDSLTTPMPDAVWTSPGPEASPLTAKRLALHPDIWNFASRWMDVRVRTLSTSTRYHWWTARNGVFGERVNRCERERAAVNDEERLQWRLPEGGGEVSNPVEIRVAQINALVHGGDLDGDLTLLTCYDELGMMTRSSKNRKDYFEQCFNEWYGELTPKAASMIVNGAKDSTSPHYHYFRNHLYFINKFVAVRSYASNDAGPPPDTTAIRRGADPSPQQRTTWRLWENCRNLFFDYTDALNALEGDSVNVDLRNEAELRARGLYEAVRALDYWVLNSKPSRMLYWKPADFMGWEWPAEEDGSLISLNSPSTKYMSRYVRQTQTAPVQRQHEAPAP
ncbi:hypothetical protein QBC39DRAFT_368642 [Podospora conica]|nr:hypothetical protein QBC39DRAFT_368642 [Schizothecium conicum]